MVPQVRDIRAPHSVPSNIAIIAIFGRNGATGAQEQELGYRADSWNSVRTRDLAGRPGRSSPPASPSRADGPPRLQ